MLNSEKLKAFPLRSGTKQGCSLLPFLLKNKSIGSSVLEVLVTAIKQKKEKEFQLERKKKNCQCLKMA